LNFGLSTAADSLLSAAPQYLLLMPQIHEEFDRGWPLKPCRFCLVPIQPSVFYATPYIYGYKMRRVAVGNQVVRFAAHKVKHVLAFLYPVLGNAIGKNVRDLTEVVSALQHFLICE
jgi:hypothetical protein